MEKTVLEMRRNLDLYEGIIIGIYGNFLIALVDKIDFGAIPLFDTALLFVSYLAFIIYFIYQISAEHPMTAFWMNILLLAFHYYGWLSAYLIQGITIERVFFSFVGVLLFGALFSAERKRTKSTA
jgi:hypothetical protein